jgi:LacI family gluconate utilization system Gnt-I transcriptional repressor
MARRPRDKSGAVRIIDVATAAGVAPMTVSRVLNSPDRVAATTAARVHEAIDRLGYVPNLMAGSLSSRRSRMVAAVVPSIGGQFFGAAVQRFTEVVSEAGYQVLLALSGRAGVNEDTVLRSVLGRRPDGVLLTGSDRSPVARRLLHDAAIPVVEMWDTSEAPLDTLVSVDHSALGAAVADFFFSAGHTCFAAVGSGYPRATARRQGFVRRVAEQGGTLVADHTLDDSSSITAGRHALREMAPLLGDRTAFFGSSDAIAFGAVIEARALGIGVPERLAVCGFGDSEVSRSTDAPFTTVAVDGKEMGRSAAEALLERMLGGPSRHIPVPFQIIPRAST